jgi:hypothetical protein|tara:strand:- start:388 stop:1407 length:1020 start_codon:yes stop_codon:yes gene_type:complete
MADFTWSFSSLKEYINCPKKYQEVRILKNYSFVDTPQTIYGKEVHEALENYVNGHIKRSNKLYNEKGQHVSKYGQVREPMEVIAKGITSKTWNKTHEELKLDKAKGGYKPLGRHDGGVRMCGYWYNLGMTEEQVREKVFEWNQLNKPPMDDKEVETILTSVGKMHQKNLEDNPEPTLAKNYLRFKKMVDALIAIPGTKYPEYKMALTKKMEQCDFDDENRWVRGIADLVIVDGDQAYIIDYKTGSNKYPDPKQLRLMSLMAFVCFPEVNTIKAGLLFCMKNSFVQESYTREDIHKSWKSFETPLDRLTMSYEKDEWIPNPTPLCGWCPVETCEHHKPRR